MLRLRPANILEFRAPFLGPENEITPFAPTNDDKIILGEKEGDIGILMTRREG